MCGRNRRCDGIWGIALVRRIRIISLRQSYLFFAVDNHILAFMREMSGGSDTWHLEGDPRYYCFILSAYKDKFRTCPEAKGVAL